jgi:hypothetical protein
MVRGGRGGSVDPKVVNNVTYAPVQRGAPVVAGARWFAADGRVIPTSDRAYRQAIAARDDAMKADSIRRYAHYSYRAAPAILADFAVFSITSRRGVRTPSGLVILRPTLSSLPFAIVNFAEPNQPARLDPTQIRQITTPAGDRFWVIPGERGLCAAVIDKVRIPMVGGLGEGGGEACSATLAQTETGGSGVSEVLSGGHSISYQVLPKSKAITIRTRAGTRRTFRPRAGTRRTFRPPHGVYVRKS